MAQPPRASTRSAKTGTEMRSNFFMAPSSVPRGMFRIVGNPKVAPQRFAT